MSVFNVQCIFNSAAGEDYENDLILPSEQQQKIYGMEKSPRSLEFISIIINIMKALTLHHSFNQGEHLPRFLHMYSVQSAVLFLHQMLFLLFRIFLLQPPGVGDTENKKYRKQKYGKLNTGTANDDGRKFKKEKE